jgi:hypothetical protein
MKHSDRTRWRHAEDRAAVERPAPPRRSVQVSIARLNEATSWTWLRRNDRAREVMHHGKRSLRACGFTAQGQEGKGNQNARPE